MYQGIVDGIIVRETYGARVGRCIIFPSSFIIGLRAMWKKYVEAIALVQNFEKLDIFPIVTCNLIWKEILDGLRPHEEVHNRPDLITCIFRAKLDELKIRLFKQKFLVRFQPMFM